jgi:hypothetical protein
MELVELAGLVKVGLKQQVGLEPLAEQVEARLLVVGPLLALQPAWAIRRSQVKSSSFFKVIHLP